MLITNVNGRIDNSRKVKFSSKLHPDSLKNVGTKIVDEFTTLVDTIGPEDSVVKALIQVVKSTSKEPRRYMTATGYYNNDGKLVAGRLCTGLIDIESALKSVKESILEIKKHYN